MKKLFIVLGGIFAFLAVGAVALVVVSQQKLTTEDPITPWKVVSEGATKNVYVALDGSPWKVETVKKVLAAFPTQVNFTVENLKTLGTFDPTGYDVVMVVAPLYAGMLQKDAQGFVNSTAEKAKVMLVVTSGSVKLEGTGVDTLTAASTDQDSGATQIISRLKAKLNLQ